MARERAIPRIIISSQGGLARAEMALKNPEGMRGYSPIVTRLTNDFYSVILAVYVGFGEADLEGSQLRLD